MDKGLPQDKIIGEISDLGPQIYPRSYKDAQEIQEGRVKSTRYWGKNEG